MLVLENVTKTYRGPTGAIRALNVRSFSADAGEFVAVQGPSGCGKTTFLLIAGGLLTPDSGNVVVHGATPYDLSPNARARFRGENVGFVFQQFHLIPYLTVLNNVAAPALVTGLPDAAERARELIAEFKVEHRLGHFPSQLSTGERQRVALARSLLNGPKLLLADEPTGNLDRENAKGVLQHLATFSAGGGTVLLVTHDPFAASFASRSCELSAGEFVGAAC